MTSLKEAMVLPLLLAACASAPTIQTPSEQPIYIPLVTAELSQPCRYVQTTARVHYVYTDIVEDYEVIDCLQLTDNWPKTIERSDIVMLDGRWGIAYQGEYWLEVLIWHGTERPYVINLRRE